MTAGWYFLLATKLFEYGLRVTKRDARIFVVMQRAGHLSRNSSEGHNRRLVDRVIQRIRGRHSADEDQHDESHALLAVVRSVRVAHTAAGAG